MEPSFSSASHNRLFSRPLHVVPGLMALAAAGWGADATAPAPAEPTGAGTELKALSLEQLMDIEVTSVSRHAEPLSQAPSAIQVVTGDEIRRSGATSLPEALRQASNLEIAQADPHSWAISARGFDTTLADKMLVLIDGRSVYTPLYAGVFWDAQDVFLPDVDRIEVISGPGATQWGANAVNGVINITSRNSKDTQGLYAEAGGGTDPRAIEGARYGGAVGRDFHWRVYEKYRNDANSTSADETQLDNHWQHGQAGMRSDWDASPVDLVTLQGDGYSGYEHVPASSDTVIQGGNVLGRWTHRFSEKSDLTLQLYWDSTYSDIAPPNPERYEERLNTFDADLQYRLPVGARNDVTCGLGYRVSYDSIGGPPFNFTFNPSKENLEWSNAFLQDEIAVVPEKVALTLGSKLEHNDFTGFEYEPSGRLAWNVDARQTVWAAVSRAVRTPSRIDTQWDSPARPPYFVLTQNNGFRSEKLIAYEAGYRIQPVPVVSLALSAYYNDYKDVRSIEWGSHTFPFPQTLGNALEGETYGAELSATWEVTETVRLRAGYNELRARLHARPGSTDTSRGGGELSDPEHQASLHASWDFLAHWEADADGRYVSEVVNGGVPPYAECNLRLAWLPNAAWELSVVGQNLLHQSHAEVGDPASRQEIDRSVYGKVVWHP